MRRAVRPSCGVGSCFPLSFASAVVLAACTTPATQLVVVVDTDLEPGREVDEVAVTVSAPGDVSETERASLGAGDRARLPLTLGVSPRGETLGPVEVRAVAQRAGTLVVARAHRVTLVRGETRLLVLHLTRDCATRACAAGATCTESGCAPVELDGDALPRWDGEAPRLDGGSAPSDASAPDDGAVPDDGAPDSALPDAGGDGGGGDVCTEASDGAACDEPTCDAWSECGEISSDPCGTTGVRRRTCTPRICADGACVAGAPYQETAECTRDTDGAACGTNDCSVWTRCDYTDVCDQSASRTRTCTDGVCAAGRCELRSAIETQECTRSTDGASCDDGLWCTDNDVCSSGFCRSGRDICGGPDCTCTPTGCRSSGPFLCAIE